MSKEAVVTEITEDIEVIGPGQILADARKGMGLSQEAVAKRLNFRLTLVKDIETECFDHSLPATYNRGYLKSYAKLVNVNENDILSSYESLGVAKTQCAEMQSFSQQTKKQAHNNILMWITYLIIAAVIGSSAMWWLQGKQFASDSAEDTTAVASTANNAVPSATEQSSATERSPALSSELSSVQLPEQSQDQSPENSSVQLANINDVSPEANAPVASDATDTTKTDNADLTNQREQPQVADNNAASNDLAAATTGDSNGKLLEPAALSTAVFNFSGDCWVNIYDVTGERIAWGIKKANYEMTISGVAPLRITLGKPELVQITFNDQAVDMSNFGRGNIAKFTLPLEQAN